MADNTDSIYQHNLATLELLIPGDLIEFHRGVWAHWGVYMGDGIVIHLTVDDEGMRSDLSHFSEICSKHLEQQTIVSSTFWKVACGQKASRNNFLDHILTPSPPSRILSRAAGKVGSIQYNLLTYNCEHFATWCRYGKTRSKQIENLFSLLTSWRVFL